MEQYASTTKRKRNEMKNQNEVVAKFSAYISLLGCMSLGIDGDCGIWVSEATRYGEMATGDGDAPLGYYHITLDCSDKFYFATGDCEGISTMEELDLFIKVCEWFLAEGYNRDEWFKEYYPTIEDYLTKKSYIISEEMEDEMRYWAGLACCMLLRGQALHPHYMKKLPAWLALKLEEEGIK